MKARTTLSEVWKALMAAACLCSLLSAEEVALPQATTIDRYQAIWTRSPFTAPSGGVGEDKASGTWVMNALAGSSDNPIVFIENKTTQERVTVTRDKNEKGFEVLSVLPQADLYQSTATLRIAGETVVVHFDKELIASRSAPALPAQQPGTTPPQGVPAAHPAPPLRLPTPPQPTSGTPVHPIHRVVIPTPPSTKPAP